jgi:hypothetical protein
MGEMMRTNFVSDTDVEKALDWLRDNAADLGRITEQAILASAMVKHVKAIEMKRHEGTAAAQEREALASQAYLDAILHEAKAAGTLATAKALREAAAAKIEVWRSAGANYRSMKI